MRCPNCPHLYAIKADPRPPASVRRICCHDEIERDEAKARKPEPGPSRRERRRVARIERRTA